MNYLKIHRNNSGFVILVWICVVVNLCDAVHPSPCDKTRIVLTEPSGTITDGPAGSNYTQDSHCEWLIKAQNASQFITLQFISMGTECSYDYIFIYDGDSFDSVLLGSFSGKTEPQKITATSGYMLILLYSDTNYVLEGFQAEYSVNDCWDGCGGKGVCVSHACVCEGEFGGRDCSYELCPDACNRNGQCRGGKCNCNKGFSGEACTLNSTDKIGNSWHWLSHSESGLTPRTAHTAVYVNITDSLYVFGGYDLNNILGSLQVYRFLSSQWEDENGKVIQGFLSNDEIDQTILRAVLSQDNVDTQRWGLKKRGSIFEQLLISTLHKPENMGITNGGHSTPFTEKLISSDTFDDNNITFHEQNKHERPGPRYGHAACRVFTGFALYGGKLRNGSLSSELWVYDVIKKKWSLRSTKSPFKPPALTRHSLTSVGDELYLFGGSTEDGDFSSRMFKIRLDTPDTETWQEVLVRGGKELDVRVVSHSAVYHYFSNSILVYGGIAAGVARFSKLSDRMFEFDLENHHWAEIHYPRGSSRDTYIPRERAFHTATVIGNYIVVFGGYSHRHNREEICYDSGLYLYHLGCHAWVPQSVLGTVTGHRSKYPKKQGIFAHAAALRPPSTLLLVGGYHGNVNGDLIAFVVPPLLGGVNGADPESACPRHKTHSECLADPECGWCSADEICYGRTVGSNCTTNLQSVRCGGVCPAMADCHSCLIHGSQSRQMSPSRFLPSVSTKLGLHYCTWCVQSAVCHQKDDNYGSCGDDTPSGSGGWWGAGGADIAEASQCARRDRRPGLTMLRHLPPGDPRRPDGVAALNATVADWPSDGGGARILGWLRLPSSAAGEAVRLCAGRARAELWLGNRSVARVQAPTRAFCSSASLPDPLPPRLRFDLRAEDASPSPSPHHRSIVELVYNRTHENSKKFTFEHLEPYSNGSCKSYDNCLMCVADVACGWCEVTGRCEHRDADEQLVCSNKIPGSSDNETIEDASHYWRYLTLQPLACPNCSNYIGCKACAEAGCEWAGDEARCGRVGRISGAVKTPENCSLTCHARLTCSDCLAPHERCVWCEATKQCFSFSVYTSEYQFGQCREWIDRTVPAILTSSLTPSLTELSGLTDDSSKDIEQCKSCSQNNECQSCLQSLSCGWCYSGENPIQGACTGGDFNKPHVECSMLLNVSVSDAYWAYAQCPDVDECGLGLHDCHKEAVCTNTHGSYSCKCLRGFIGDGRTSCTRTCYNNCIHGYCIGPPDYTCQCDLGWTGVDCSENCGCHNHSTCHSSIGICDECQDWTEGEFCQSCKPGSYGNATTSRGCRRCDCNSHGDPILGVCNSETGLCFCQDNTEGPNCEKCSKDYYGDPKHGGRCYYHCEARGMLSGVLEQGIGSHKVHSSPWGGPPAKECLWIISPGDSASHAIIQFSVNSSQLNVSCNNNAVYAFDGLPDLAGVQQSQLIGVFCNDASPGTVEAKSGHLTVHYKQGPDGEGFEGVYKIISCEKGCPSPWVCKNDNCACTDGIAGPLCNKELCPRNCSASLDQGTCDKGYGRCICSSGWGGEDCSLKILPHQLVFTNLFDSDFLADNQDHLRKTLPRFGHTLVADRRGSLWMFGGHSLSHGPLNDIRLFDTRNNTWMQVTVEATPDARMPEGRYFHASEILHSRQIIYIFGGLSLQNYDNSSKTLGDFWQFSLKDQRWAIIPEGESPPPLAGHTLTLQKNQDSESLVLIGGFSPEHGFLSDIWEFDVETNKWKKLKTLGPKPIGIYGHTTVFHILTQSFYIYGGYLYSPNGTHISNKLFSFYYPTLSWNEIPPFPELNGPDDNLPRARFLHSAATTDDYMIVFGGKTEPYNATDSLIAYVYKCNQWIRLMQDAEIIGVPPPATVAQAMTLDGDSGALYVVGGWRGSARCRVTRAILPSDLCRLWSSGKRACRLRAGCSYCAVIPAGSNSFTLTGQNVARCYSASSPAPSDPCSNSNGTLLTNNGAACDVALVTRRDCSQFTSCATCVPIWPSHFHAEVSCQWCLGCGKGMCVPYNTNCLDSALKCDQPFTAITHVDVCPGTSCTVADCEQCTEEDCQWSRQVYFQDNAPPIVDEDPLHHWACINKRDLGRGLSKLSEAGKCPIRCHEHHSCRTCLQSDGAEGGAQSCRWAVQLNRCIAPAHRALICAGGICGRVLLPGEEDICPAPCASFTQCSDCLRRAHCGWCSRNDHLDGSGGDGVCVEGSLDSPADRPALSTCDVLYETIKHGSLHNIEKINLNDTFSWNYIRCPREDECENGHHSCDPQSEKCVDLPAGFECACGTGYSAAGGGCVPVCSQGCVRGTCVRPDLCECDFGYVGANCSIQCQCNGHADCEGPDKLNICLECHNNTMGKQCEKCKPLFVGDPTDNGQCVPCLSYCYGHSSICMHDASDLPPPNHEMSISEIEVYLGEGPSAKAKCLRCSNHTDGPRCDKCIDGHFRGSEDYRDACRRCECHGHGDVCDPVTGEKCNCGNNTESDATCQTSSSSKNSAQECWRYQCVKCKDSYMGDPKNGHQCYRMMTADNRMCFDAKLIDECKIKPKPLFPGQTVFFVVIPRFMNVDIRVIVDVTQGSLDLFMSPNSSIFVVTENDPHGIHEVELDPSYFNLNPFKGDEYLRNDPDRVHRSFDIKTGFTIVDLKVKEKDLTNHITVETPNTLLRVRDLKNRLILTLPQDVHDLGFTKFYLVLKSVFEEDAINRPSYGMVFFRQDQLHIDLFVFFSVFFSCFFLFLAACVVAWKAKQAADVRRARRRHVVEMLHMAKRPFAGVTVVLHGTGALAGGPRRKRRTSDVRPVAVEPTADGRAAIATVLVRLPGGRSAPSRLALASSLALLATRPLRPARPSRALLRRRTPPVPPLVPQ